MQERRARQPGHQRGVLDRVPAPVAAPAELRVGPAGAEQDAKAEEQPGGEREAADGSDPLGVDPSREQRAHAEGQRDRAQRVARVEHRRMDHHRREAQQRIEPGAFDRRGPRDRKRRRVEDHQRDEEAAQPEQDRCGIGGHVAHPPAREEQGEARPQRQKPGPQKQRAFLRGPHGRGPVEGRRGAAGGVGDGVEGEVVAQERDLEHDERHGQDAGQRVHRAAPGFRELRPSPADAVQGRADAVDAHAERQKQARTPQIGHQRLLVPRTAGDTRVSRLRMRRVWYPVPARPAAFVDAPLDRPVALPLEPCGCERGAAVAVKLSADDLSVADRPYGSAIENHVLGTARAASEVPDE